MKNIKMKIVRFLMDNLTEEKNLIIAILTPLKTEQQATLMLNWLEENKDNKELMREDRILQKVLEIYRKN